MRPLLIFLLISFSLALSAQDTVPEIKVVKPQTVTEGIVFKVVEQMPEYPGGDEAKLKFINSNLQYPATDREKGIGGVVGIMFIIREDGMISNIRIAKGISPGLDAEAFRIVTLFPRFIPGRQSGIPIAVDYYQPVIFNLSSASEQLHKAYKH